MSPGLVISHELARFTVSYDGDVAWVEGALSWLESFLYNSIVISPNA